MPGVINKEGPIEKFFNFPSNFINNAVEDIQCWDWDSIGEKLSFPVGIGCHFILFLFAIGRINDHDPSFEVPTSSWSQLLQLNQFEHWAQLFEYALICFSFINIINLLFFKFKYYQLFFGKVDDQEIFLNKNTELRSIFDRLPWWSQRWWGSWLYNLVKDYLPKGGPEVIHLKVWNYNAFQLNVACLFSPASVILLKTLTYDNWYWLTLISALISVQSWCLKNQFIQLLKDKQLIHSQLMNEYNSKFVNQFFKLTKDRACQTDDESLTLPNGSRKGSIVRSDKTLSDFDLSSHSLKSRSPTNPFQSSRF